MKSRRAVLLFGMIELMILLTAFERSAYAYVDPGSGLLAIQVGGSMLAGALFLLRSKLRRLLGVLSRDAPRKDEAIQ